MYSQYIINPWNYWDYYHREQLPAGLKIDVTGDWNTNFGFVHLTLGPDNMTVIGDYTSPSPGSTGEIIAIFNQVLADGFILKGKWRRKTGTGACTAEGGVGGIRFSFTSVNHFDGIWTCGDSTKALGRWNGDRTSKRY